MSLDISSFNYAKTLLFLNTNRFYIKCYDVATEDLPTENKPTENKPIKDIYYFIFSLSENSIINDYGLDVALLMNANNKSVESKTFVDIDLNNSYRLFRGHCILNKKTTDGDIFLDMDQSKKAMLHIFLNEYKFPVYELIILDDNEEYEDAFDDDDDGYVDYDSDDDEKMNPFPLDSAELAKRKAKRKAIAKQKKIEDRKQNQLKEYKDKGTGGILGSRPGAALPKTDVSIRQFRADKLAPKNRTPIILPYDDPYMIKYRAEQKTAPALALKENTQQAPAPALKEIPLEYSEEQKKAGAAIWPVGKDDPYSSEVANKLLKDYKQQQAAAALASKKIPLGPAKKKPIDPANEEFIAIQSPNNTIIDYERSGKITKFTKEGEDELREKMKELGMKVIKADDANTIMGDGWQEANNATILQRPLGAAALKEKPIIGEEMIKLDPEHTELKKYQEDYKQKQEVLAARPKEKITDEIDLSFLNNPDLQSVQNIDATQLVANATKKNKEIRDIQPYRGGPNIQEEKEEPLNKKRNLEMTGGSRKIHVKNMFNNDTDYNEKIIYIKPNKKLMWTTINASSDRKPIYSYFTLGKNLLLKMVDYQTNGKNSYATDQEKEESKKEKEDQKKRQENQSSWMGQIKNVALGLGTAYVMKKGVGLATDYYNKMGSDVPVDITNTSTGNSSNTTDEFVPIGYGGKRKTKGKKYFKSKTKNKKYFKPKSKTKKRKSKTKTKNNK
jgi:hypothetical protein